MKHKKLTTQEKSIFCNEIAIILSSGLTIQEGLTIIYPELISERLKKVTQDLLTAYQQYGKFYDALIQCDMFDSYMEEMVQIGEESGNLDDVMTQLSAYYERHDDMQQQVKDAITYPLILMVMMLVVIAILVLKILPIFQNVLTDLGANLSPFAQILMDYGNAFAFISFMVLCILAVCMMGFYVYTKINRNTNLQEKFFASFFMTKKLFHNISMANITYALSLFISSGYPIEEAVQFLPNFVNHPQLKKKLETIITKMNDVSFADAIKAEGLYEGVYANMVQIGFKSGKQDVVLKKLVLAYEKEVDASISRFLNIIEPTIVAVLSFVVGIILLSVMLPLMSIMSSLG